MLLTLHGTMPIGADLVRQVLDVPGLAAHWRDIDDDAQRVAPMIAAALHPRAQRRRAGAHRNGQCRFYRNRGATLIGRIHLPPRPDGTARRMPLMIALLNGHDGIFADAVLTDSDEIAIRVLTTLANFHATNPHYHELAQFCSRLMPKRPLGMHYSTIGYNHTGKVAVINEIAREQRRTGERLDTAVGFRGTVAIGFSMPSSRYVLKIIRDKPTDGYKWGALPRHRQRAATNIASCTTWTARARCSTTSSITTSSCRPMFAPALLDELHTPPVAPSTPRQRRLYSST